MQLRMLKMTAFLPVILALLLLNGCDMSATMDFDQDVDFSTVKTYQWAGEKKEGLSDLVHKRIIEYVDVELAAKGLSKVASDPDVYVIYHGDDNEMTVLNTSTYGYGYGRGWGYYGGGMGGSTTTVSTYTEGTLVIDMYSAEKKELIWRGSVTGTIDEDPQKNAKIIKKAVEKLFKKYPPEKKK